MKGNGSKIGFRWLVAVSLCVLAACVTVPTQDDVAAGRATIVMVRYAMDVPGEPHFGAFTNSSITFNLGVRWGNVETGGVPTDGASTFYKYMSDGSRGAGWVYFMLKPGRHYMAVMPAHAGQPQYAFSLKYEELFKTAAPRWVVDIPAGAPVVYAGTLTFGKVRVQKPSVSLGAKLWIADFDAGATAIRDETDQAAWLARQHFSRFGDPKTALMRRHTDNTYRF